MEVGVVQPRHHEGAGQVDSLTSGSHRLVTDRRDDAINDEQCCGPG